MLRPAATFRFALLVGAIFSLPIPFALAAPKELNNVPLVVTRKYDPTKEEARGFSEFTSSFSLATFGNLFRSAAIDIEGDIKGKLNMPELKRYFPSAKENAAIAKAISNKVNRDHLNGGLTNDRVIGAIGYASTELVGRIINRALEVEGVKGKDRRAQWAEKILLPFRGCIKKTRTYKEAERCLDTLQTDLVQNIGLGIGYEMIRQETGVEYTKGMPKSYDACLRIKTKSRDSRVQSCIVNSMRKAVESFGIDQVSAVAKEQSPSSAKAVAARVRPDFSKCLAKASERKTFAACADLLVAKAGSEIAAEAVKVNPQVLQYFAEKDAREKLAGKAKTVFADCMAGVKKSNERDNKGTLKTDSCVQRVKLETALSVAHALFASNLKKLQGIADEDRVSIKSTVSAELDACWDAKGTLAKNNGCMRNAIESLVAAVADVKLAKELPATLRAKEPKLKDQLVGSVRACVKNTLPENILESADAAKKVEDCAAGLLKDAAQKVAGHSLEEVLHGKTSDLEAGKRLTEKLVTKEFATCLGSAPSEKKLASCSAVLKRSAGVEVARLLFKEEFEKFVEGNGGQSALGLDQPTQEKYLSGLLGSHERCLTATITAEKPEKADSAVDACFKESIRGLASHLANLVFIKQLKDNLPNGRPPEDITLRFTKDFDTCLREKEAPEFTVNAYVANIGQCKNRLMIPYTLEIGKMQLASALQQNLPGEGSALENRRQEIQGEVVGQLETCLTKAGAEEKDGREDCVGETKKLATYLIAVEATREQAKEVLNGGEPPKELAQLEVKLKTCLSNQDADICAKEQAQGVAKLLGSLKLRTTLGEALGEKEFKASAGEIEEMEKTFTRCVNKLPPRKAYDDFLLDLKACGEGLEHAGVALVQSRLAKWLETPEMTPAQKKISQELAVVLPCFDQVLPAGPIQENALQALDPEGMLLPVARTIADYINYDAENAGKDFDKVIKQLENDLKAAGPVEARRRLLDLLLQSGMLDRLLKSMALSEVRKSLESLPPEDRLPPALARVLLDRATIDKALTPEIMENLRPLISEKILKPLLLEGRSLKDPAQNAAVAMLSQKVASALLESPEFGQRLVAGAVQQQIDAQTSGTVSRWFFNSVGYSYDWNALRLTERGRAAEAYVKENVIRPRVMGESISREEMRRRNAEASRLVTEAVKNQ